MALPFSASRIIRGSKRLSPEAKLVWLELQIFDRGDAGAWIGAKTLADRLGMTADAIDWQRRELRRHGLLRNSQANRGEPAHWFCCLPLQCVPSRRPSIEEVQRLVTLLDTQLGGGVSHTGAPAEALSTATRHSPVSHTALPAQTRGEVRPPLHPELQVGENLQPQDGEGAYSRDEDGELRVSQRGEPQAIGELVGGPDMYLTLEQQAQRRALLARRRGVAA